MGISLSIPSWMSRRVVSGEKERNMLRNGGLLLEELLRSCDGKCNPFRIFSAKELAQATNDYQEMLVETNFDRMYRGFINGCSPISVKCTRRRGDIDIETSICMVINEIVFASQLNNHKNVLMLLGCCLETKVPVLVYEYAENGVLLDRILHTPIPKNFYTLGRGNFFIGGGGEGEGEGEGEGGGGGSRQLLAWDCRLKVAKEIADSLAYLHTGFSTPIVHRDINPDNIFLDANYVAKLSDFSMSISIPLGEEYVETNVAGCLGYLAPECFETSRVTEKCDVFSFGTLLFENFSGQKYFQFIKGERILATSGNLNLEDVFGWEVGMEYLHQAIVEGAEKCIGPENMLDTHFKQIMALSKLAFHCHKGSAEERPTMTQVAKELRRIIRFHCITP